MCRPVIGVVTMPACCGRAGGTIQQVAQAASTLESVTGTARSRRRHRPGPRKCAPCAGAPGRCTGCTHQLYLTREDARDCVQIHTVDPLPFAGDGRSKSDIAPSRFLCTVRRGRCAAFTTTRSASIGTSRPSPCVATRLSRPVVQIGDALNGGVARHCHVGELWATWEDSWGDHRNAVVQGPPLVRHERGMGVWM